LRWAERRPARLSTADGECVLAAQDRTPFGPARDPLPASGHEFSQTNAVLREVELSDLSFNFAPRIPGAAKAHGNEGVWPCQGLSTQVDVV